MTQKPQRRYTALITIQSDNRWGLLESLDRLAEFFVDMDRERSHKTTLWDTEGTSANVDVLEDPFMTPEEYNRRTAEWVNQ